MFRKFAEFQSVRQVHLWLRQEEALLPSVETEGELRRIVCKLPVYNTVRGLLTNPVYGGAYAFGRTASRVTLENGRKRVSRGHRRDREEWDVLIVDHHEGYVSWAEFERNQRLIADNANCRGLMVRGAVRRGDALLAGLMRCDHCGGGCTSSTAVPTAFAFAMRAGARRSTMGPRPAFPSAACASMRRSPPRRCGS